MTNDLKMSRELLTVLLSKWPQGYKQRIVMIPWGIVVSVEYKCKYAYISIQISGLSFYNRAPCLLKSISMKNYYIYILAKNMINPVRILVRGFTNIIVQIWIQV